jgi:hypothetical protein
MVKAAFNKKRTFYQHMGLKFKEETSEVLHLKHNCMVLKLGHFSVPQKS